jgi:ABC-2 type transport system permease protein
MNFLVMPIYFLSGALFPLDNQKIGMRIANQIDPLSYGVDGLRGMLTNVWHFTPSTNLTVLTVVAGAFLLLGAYLFSKIEA